MACRRTVGHRPRASRRGTLQRLARVDRAAADRCPVPEPRRPWAPSRVPMTRRAWSVPTGVISRCPTSRDQRAHQRPQRVERRPRLSYRRGQCRTQARLACREQACRGLVWRGKRRRLQSQSAPRLQGPPQPILRQRSGWPWSVWPGAAVEMARGSSPSRHGRAAGGARCPRMPRWPQPGRWWRWLTAGTEPSCDPCCVLIPVHRPPRGLSPATGSGIWCPQPCGTSRTRWLPCAP
jgi:hypothetical protein